MSKVYESLREVVQETLQRNKTTPIPLARVRPSDASNLNEEIEKLEKLITQKIGHLKTAVKQGEDIVSNETQRAEQTISSLNETVSMLENKLKEAEETIRRKEFAREKMEESLTAKIDGLENDLKTKKEDVQRRDFEVSGLKSNVEALQEKIAQTESEIQQAKAKAASEAKHADELTESYGKNIAALEGKLKAAEETIGQRESRIKSLEQNLSGRTQEFERRLREKETFLATREAEIKDLKSQLELLTRGVKEMSSFFKQAEALAGVDSQTSVTTDASQTADGMSSKSAAAEVKIKPVASKAGEIAQPPLPANFFNLLTDELTKIMGPMAAMIVRDHVAALGESMDKFPRQRVGELRESLTKEILNDKLKKAFQEWFAKQL